MAVQVTSTERRINRDRARRVVAVGLAIGSVILAVLGVIDMLETPIPAPIELPAYLP